MRMRVLLGRVLRRMRSRWMRRPVMVMRVLRFTLLVLGILLLILLMILNEPGDD